MKKGKRYFFKRFVVMLVIFTMTLTSIPFDRSKVLAADNSEIAFKSADYRVLYVGESYDFDLVNTQAGAKYTWSSSKPKIAIVNSNGLVTAISAGLATITCKVNYNNETTVLEAKVYVKKISNTPLDKISITNKVAYIGLGETHKFGISESPANGYDWLNWTSSNTAVATVNKDGVVTAKANGRVKITATTMSGKVSDQTTFVVEDSKKISTQEELEQCLKSDKAYTIILKTEGEVNFVIPKGDYSNKKLVVYAPNASVNNEGLFQLIEIRSLKQWNESHKDNKFSMLSSTAITVKEDAYANFIINCTGLVLKYVINGNARFEVKKPSTLQLDGTTKNALEVNANSKNVIIQTKLPVTLLAEEIVQLELQSDAAAKSTFKVDREDLVPKVKGNGIIQGTVGDKSCTVTGEGTVIGGTTSGGTSSSGSTPGGNPTPIPTPTLDPVDNGLDANGRMVAFFGTPVIDGLIDDIWNKAVAVAPKVSSGTTTTTATFKTLWDDNAIYFLAEVKDTDLSAEAANVYERDSVEFFLDELNNKTVGYDGDDLQYRINYVNQKSGDHGELTRFYPIAKIVEGGYVVEGRISLTQKPENDKVMGIEMQINDAKGSSRIATLNMFDMTGKAFENTSLFGEVILTGKGSQSVSGLNPYTLISLIESAKEIELIRYQNGDTVNTLVRQAEALIADKNTTQQQIDDLAVKLDNAIKALKHNNLSFDEKECRQVPMEYKMTDQYPGTIVRLDYDTSTYDSEDLRDIQKYLHVYLPYGYDQNNKDKKYNVLYLIHGMSENQHTIFGGPGQTSELMKIVDNMIADGKLDPMIIVTPTWQVEGTKKDMFGLVDNFHHELVNDIIPLVEGTYNTYATSTLPEDLIAAREHRAFGGFSMGGGCTWYNYIYCIDYFKYYVPLSLWCLQDVSSFGYSGTSDEQMAQYLADVARKAGYTKDDIRIFCATGTDDMAYSGMKNQIEAMKKEDSMFVYSADLRKGNFYFLQLAGGTHIWNCVNRYLYNILPDLFQTYWVDSDGLDESGRAVAQFGSPIIDGNIDGIWDEAKNLVPKYNSSNDGTKVTFKTMWDDNALYVLAQLKDTELSVASTNPYEQDSIEIFVDENNDKSKEFGVDDLQFRINYENTKTADKGDINRLYSQTKLVDGGYIIEARIEFLHKENMKNDQVLGIELQINAAKGASRVGTLNVFDGTNSAWNDTSLFGNIVLKGKTTSSMPSVNPYILLSLIDNTKSDLDPNEYSNYSLLEEAMNKASSVANDKNSTQADLDQEYVNIQEAIKSLIYTEEALKVKRFVTMPDEYKGENEQKGTIVTMTYDAPNTSDGIDTKRMNIYLPYGYDQSNTVKKYNVLYLMHGGGENENTLFGGEGQSLELKRILDNMIAKGDIEPFIVVTPTSNGGANDVALFYKELTDIVVPLVEKTYNTNYDATLDNLEAMKASRDHRAFGGFSMGSICTWYVFCNCLDYFKYYLPFSGECRGTGNDADKASVAQYLADVVSRSEYTGINGFKLYCATGSTDIAYPNMNPMIEEMKKLSDTFIFDADITKGNSYYIVAKNATHAWNFVNQYIYNILPDVFK